MKTKTFSVILPLLSVSVLSAIAADTPPPGTDIYLADFSVTNGKYKFGNPLNITSREGYDNQPSFLPDGNSLYYTSIREDEQADVFRYDINDKKTTRITNTKESEYSPTVMPGENYFSTVRVEADGTQRLWKFPLEGGEPSLVLTNILPVGYHSWLDAGNLALFVLGAQNTLQLVNIQDGSLNIVKGNIGRSLHKIPGADAVSFVDKTNEKNWLIYSYNIKTGREARLGATLPGSEDFAWTNTGEILMAKGSLLYKFKPGSDKTWQQITDFKTSGVKEILRLSVNRQNNRLAFVSNISK